MKRVSALVLAAFLCVAMHGCGYSLDEKKNGIELTEDNFMDFFEIIEDNSITSCDQKLVFLGSELHQRYAGAEFSEDAQVKLELTMVKRSVACSGSHQYMAPTAWDAERETRIETIRLSRETFSEIGMYDLSEIPINSDGTVSGSYFFVEDAKVLEVRGRIFLPATAYE